MNIAEYFVASQKYKIAASLEVGALWRLLQGAAEKKFVGFQAPDDITPIVSYTTPSGTLRIGDASNVVINAFDLAREEAFFKFCFFHGARECLFSMEFLVKRDMVTTLVSNHYLREAAALIVAAEKTRSSMQYDRNMFDELVNTAKYCGGEVLPDCDQDLVKVPLEVYSYYRRGFLISHELAHCVLRDLPSSRDYAEQLLAQSLGWCKENLESVRIMPAGIWSHEVATFDLSQIGAMMSDSANVAMLEEIPKYLSRDAAAKEEVLCDLIAQDLMEEIMPLPSEPERLIAFQTLAGINCAYWKWLALAKIRYLALLEGDEDRLESHYCGRQIRNFLSYARLERKKRECEQTGPDAREIIRTTKRVFGGTLQGLYMRKQEPVFQEQCMTAGVLVQAIDTYYDALRDISDEELAFCIEDFLVDDERANWRGVAQDRPPFCNSALGKVCEIFTSSHASVTTSRVGPIWTRFLRKVRYLAPR